MSYMVELEHFLNVRVTRPSTFLQLDQTVYASDVLKKFKLSGDRLLRPENLHFPVIRLQGLLVRILSSELEDELSRLQTAHLTECNIIAFGHLDLHILLSVRFLSAPAARPLGTRCTPYGHLLATSLRPDPLDPYSTSLLLSILLILSTWEDCYKRRTGLTLTTFLIVEYWVPYSPCPCILAPILPMLWVYYLDVVLTLPSLHVNWLCI